MADIDLFKDINDTAGHQCGDEAIQIVAKILEQSVRKDDVVIRYGGESVILPRSPLNSIGTGNDRI